MEMAEGILRDRREAAGIVVSFLPGGPRAYQSEARLASLLGLGVKGRIAAKDGFDKCGSMQWILTHRAGLSGRREGGESKEARKSGRSWA